jgi:hypothetical protein
MILLNWRSFFRHLLGWQRCNPLEWLEDSFVLNPIVIIVRNSSLPHEGITPTSRYSWWLLIGKGHSFLEVITTIHKIYFIFIITTSYKVAPTEQTISIDN